MANGMQRQKVAKDWIGKAVKREAAPDGAAPFGFELQAAIKDMEGRKDKDPSLLAALRLAKRFKQPGGI